METIAVMVLAIPLVPLVVKYNRKYDSLIPGAGITAVFASCISILTGNFDATHAWRILVICVVLELGISFITRIVWPQLVLALQFWDI